MASNNAEVLKTTLRLPKDHITPCYVHSLAHPVRYFEMDWQLIIRFDRYIVTVYNKSPYHSHNGSSYAQEQEDPNTFMTLIKETGVLDSTKSEQHRASTTIAKIDILNSNGIPIFTFIGQWGYLKQQTFEKFCNWTEISRQHKDLFSNDNSLNMVLSVGPLQCLAQPYTDKSLVLSLKTMFETGILTDAVIKTETKTFPCHKVVLAAASDVFKTMFEIDMKESADNAVHLEDVFEADTIQDLLHYVYTMQVPPNIESTCSTLFVAADYFQLPVLKELCEKKLCEVIEVENAASILQLGHNHKSDELKKTAVKFIVSNYEEVMATSGWNDISPDMAKHLLATFLVTVAQKNN